MSFVAFLILRSYNQWLNKCFDPGGKTRLQGDALRKKLQKWWWMAILKPYITGKYPENRKKATTYNQRSTKT